MADRSDAIRAAAAAIANSRGNRRGAPDIVNVLEMLQANGLKHLYDEVMEDAEAALAAANCYAAPALTRAAMDVLAERQRQIAQEGWTPEHDDKHERGQLSRAALGYVAGAALTLFRGDLALKEGTAPLFTQDYASVAFAWPWSFKSWRPGTVRRMLVKASGLIIAEIERLDRAEARSDG